MCSRVLPPHHSNICKLRTCCGFWATTLHSGPHQMGFPSRLLHGWHAPLVSDTQRAAGLQRKGSKKTGAEKSGLSEEEQARTALWRFGHRCFWQRAVCRDTLQKVLADVVAAVCRSHSSGSCLRRLARAPAGSWFLRRQ